MTTERQVVLDLSELSPLVYKIFRCEVFKLVSTLEPSSTLSFDDEQELRNLYWHIQRGDVVLDIGAAHGSYALPAGALGAKVYAFEPDAKTRKSLLQNISLNEFADNCVVLDYGLHTEDGYFDTCNNRFSREPIEGSGVVAVRTVEHFLQNHPLEAVDWLKLDIEGAELAVLPQFADVIRRFRPQILVENHLFHDETIEEQLRAFVFGLQLGYHANNHTTYFADGRKYSHTFYFIPDKHSHEDKLPVRQSLIRP